MVRNHISFTRLAKVLCLFAAFLVFNSTLRAQGFSAQVSSKKVQAGVPFEYAIVITVAASNYVPPTFRDFEIVGGPNQSTSVQYVNGVMSQQMTIAYALVARKEGKYTIGPASVMSNGQKLETAPIAMEVVKGAVSPGSDQQNGSKVTGEDVFIRTGVSKQSCYLGEQILITQKVYSRFSIVGFKKVNPPAYDAFYAESMEPISKGQVATENVDGVVYYTYEIFRTLATANKSGRISLNPMTAEVVIRKQTTSKPRNLYEQFFGAAGYEDLVVNAKSRPLNVEVLALPEAGKPERFGGAVGNFTYKAQASKTELKANDAFNLKLTLSGKGNLALVNAPKLDLPESFETYEPKTSQSGNSKTFDYLIIPRQEGDFALDGLDFSFFNLDTKKYTTIPADPIRIKVLPPDPNSAGAQVFTPHSQVKETENDIRYIKKGEFRMLRSESEFFNSATHVGLLVGIVVLLLTLIFLRRTHLRNNSDLVAVKERKAAGLAKKQLAKAEAFMARNQKDEFYTEVLTALNNYLSHKLNLPVAELSREAIHQSLSRRQVDANTIQKLIATLETSEYAKYAPGAVSGDLQTVYKDTAGLVTSIEQQLSKRQS